MNYMLGTAQLGMSYGISNHEDRPALDHIYKILSYAYEHGVRSYDTASVYGDAELILGQFIQGKDNVDIITKIPRLGDHPDKKKLVTYLESSLRNLRVSKIRGLLLHSANDLLGEHGDSIYRQVVAFKEQGLVSQIGVSVYEKKQIDLILDRYQMDIIQLPLNVYDQRLLENGYFEILKTKGVDLHVRSIFLQGLLLMNLNEIPEFFDSVKVNMADYYQYILSCGLTKLQAALSFINCLGPNVVVFGVNTLSHLKEILSMPHHPINIIDFRKFSIKAPSFLNPSSWVL